MSGSAADVPDCQYRAGVGRRVPALVQLRRQVAIPERHLDPVGTSWLQVRRGLRAVTEERRDLRSWQPWRYRVLRRSVGDPEQREWTLPTRLPDAGNRAVDLHHRDADRELRFLQQLVVQRVRPGRLAPDVAAHVESRAALRRLPVDEPGERRVCREPDVSGAQGDRQSVWRSSEDRYQQLRT